MGSRNASHQTSASADGVCCGGERKNHVNFFPAMDYESDCSGTEYDIKDAQDILQGGIIVFSVPGYVNLRSFHYYLYKSASARMTKICSKRSHPP